MRGTSGPLYRAALGYFCTSEISQLGFSIVLVVGFSNPGAPSSGFEYF